MATNPKAATPAKPAPAAARPWLSVDSSPDPVHQAIKGTGPSATVTGARQTDNAARFAGLPTPTPHIQTSNVEPAHASQRPAGTETPNAHWDKDKVLPAPLVAAA